MLLGTDQTISGVLSVKAKREDQAISLQPLKSAWISFEPALQFMNYPIRLIKYFFFAFVPAKNPLSLTVRK